MQFMAIKHKVLKDFQLITEEKKILILKAKTIVENYKFKNKNELVSVPPDVIRNNPDYFALFDWKEELQTFLRTNKIPQPAVITKKIVPFIESLMEENDGPTKEIIIEKEVIKEVVVEKPKIVEKEVIVEKPKIVEKEVIIEKIVSDNSISVELESKINKVELKEKQLDKEIQENNQRELDLQNLQKKLDALSSELDAKSTLLENKESQLNEKDKELSLKEEELRDKESNLYDYVSRAKLNQRIQDLKNQGKVMDLYEMVIQSL